MDLRTRIDIDIVDDEQQVCDLLIAFAECAGITAKGYSSAEDYLAFTDSVNYIPPRLAVVTDIRMPGKSGYELMREVRKKNPKQRFVVMSGTPHDTNNTDEKACFYLCKPVDFERMLTIFDKLMSCSTKTNCCVSQADLYKSLSDLTVFNITDWCCPH